VFYPDNYSERLWRQGQGVLNVTRNYAVAETFLQAKILKPKWHCKNVVVSTTKATTFLFNRPITFFLSNAGLGWIHNEET